LDNCLSKKRKRTDLDSSPNKKPRFNQRIKKECEEDDEVMIDDLKSICFNYKEKKRSLRTISESSETFS